MSRLPELLLLLVALQGIVHAQDAKQAEFLRLLNELRADPYARAEEWWGFPRSEMEAFLTCPDASLAPVHWNHRLSMAAARQVAWCAKHETLSHYQHPGEEVTALERLAAVGLVAPSADSWYPQEILAFCPLYETTGLSPEDPLAWLFIWFDSASHRKTILDPEIDHIGLSSMDGRLRGIATSVPGKWVAMLALQTSARSTELTEVGNFPGPRGSMASAVNSIWQSSGAEYWRDCFARSLGTRCWIDLPQSDAPHWIHQPELGWIWLWNESWVWDPAATSSVTSRLLGLEITETCTGQYRANWGERRIMQDHVARGLPPPDPVPHWAYLAEGRPPLPKGWFHLARLPWLWHADTGRWFQLQASEGRLSGLHIYAAEQRRWTTLRSPTDN